MDAAAKGGRHRQHRLIHTSLEPVQLLLCTCCSITLVLLSMHNVHQLSRTIKLPVLLQLREERVCQAKHLLTLVSAAAHGLEGTLRALNLRR
jgi:hypothetical protein